MLNHLIYTYIICYINCLFHRVCWHATATHTQTWNNTRAGIATPSDTYGYSPRTALETTPLSSSSTHFQPQGGRPDVLYIAITKKIPFHPDVTAISILSADHVRNISVSPTRPLVLQGESIGDETQTVQSPTCEDVDIVAMQLQALVEQTYKRSRGVFNGHTFQQRFFTQHKLRRRYPPLHNLKRLLLTL